MTPEQLAEIKAREQSATPGPWTVDGLYVKAAGVHLADMEWLAETDAEWAQMSADAQFVAHTRQDVPALLAEVERLRAELTEIHGDIRFCLKVIFDGDWTRTESVLAARRSRLVGLSIPHGGQYDPKTPDGGETP